MITLPTAGVNICANARPKRRRSLASDPCSRHNPGNHVSRNDIDDRRAQRTAQYRNGDVLFRILRPRLRWRRRTRPKCPQRRGDGRTDRAKRKPNMRVP